MAASTAAYKVPDWAVKNKQVFLSAASQKRGDVAPPANTQRSLLRMSLADLQEITNNEQEIIKGAMSMAVLAEEVSDGIEPPTVIPGADYFKDVANHPDVLSTIIATARVTVGFVPEITGSELSDEQAQEYVDKFNAFLAELDEYLFYINLTSSGVQTIDNDKNDCSLMLSTMTGVLAKALGVDPSGSVFDALTANVSTLVKAAVNRVTVAGKATSANFEMLGLPKSNVVGQDPYRDPIAAVTFTATILSQQQSGKNASHNTTITISSNSYQLKSTTIVAFADYLAGSPITGNKALSEYINAPLTIVPINKKN